MQLISVSYGKGSGYRDDIYHSKRPLEPIPKDPFLDWTTYSLDQPHLDRVAVVDAPSGESMTFRELKNRVYSTASALASVVGVQQGDVVMILSPNSIHFPVIVFAITAIGAVVTTVNPAYTISEVEKQAKDSNTKFIVTVPGLAAKAASLKLPLILIDMSVPEKDEVEQTRGFTPIAYLSELYKGNPSKVPKVRIGQTDTAILLYSSGTTGLSKGVILTHGNVIAASAISTEPADKLGVQRTYVTVIPFYHVYGLVVLLAAQLRKGCKLVVIPKFEFPEFLAAIECYKITHVPVVPPILIALVKSPLVEKYDLSSIQVIGVGAAPCGMELITASNKRFRGVYTRQGFGMTETAGMGATIPVVEGLSAPHGSVGLLAANFEAQIVDVESGKPLPPTQQGELWLRGPSVMKGYLNNERATLESVDKERWLHTGDIGYFDEEGYLFIVDRLKELIKYNGLQVAPAELEALLLSHPKILDAAVAGFPDEQTGQIPVAFVVKMKGCSLSEEDVKNFVAGQVASYKKVRKVVFVESVPKSASGKLLRRELKLLPVSKL